MPPSSKDEQDQGNTTIVKGEDPWPRPSSLESIYLETEPVAANLFAQANTSQRLESPESVEDDTSHQDLRLLDSYTDRHIHKLPGQGQRSARASMEERLQAMPVRRELPWRPGVGPGAETETGGDSRRKQIRFGCLLATRGDVAPVPCNSCANGRGKFSVCVFLDGYFKGACASCQLSGRPNRCSIKQNDDVVSSPPVGTPREVHGDVPINGGHHEPPAKSPQAKRRRTNKSLLEQESSHPQWEKALGDSQARLPMNEIVPARRSINEIVPARQSVNDIPPPQRPMNEIVPVQGSWASVNASSLAQAPPFQTMQNGTNGARSVSRNSIGRTASLGWATVNQQSPASAIAPLPPPPTPEPAVHNINGGYSVESGHRSNQDETRRESTFLNEGGSGSLIDTFPKSKQRQLYGLMSGLQGGIENLQRELDTLKKALGIDDEN